MKSGPRRNREKKYTGNITKRPGYAKGLFHTCDGGKIPEERCKRGLHVQNVTCKKMPLNIETYSTNPRCEQKCQKKRISMKRDYKTDLERMLLIRYGQQICFH